VKLLIKKILNEDVTLLKLRRRMQDIDDMLWEILANFNKSNEKDKHKFIEDIVEILFDVLIGEDWIEPTSENYTLLFTLFADKIANWYDNYEEPYDEYDDIVNESIEESDIIEYFQYRLDSVVEMLKQKCFDFFNYIENMDDGDLELDYDSLDICREIQTISSIQIIDIKESSYSYKLDVQINYDEELPRPIGYGQDQLLTSIEVNLKKYFDKQVFLFTD
jgi:hypothetical protein